MSKLARFKKQVEIPEDELAAEVEEYVRDRTERFSPQIAATLIRDLKAQLIAGIRAGERVSDLERRIHRLLVDDAPDRINKIVRTEVVAAMNAGSISAYTRSGIVTHKEWVTARDEWVRGDRPWDRFSHIAADGQIEAEARKIDPFTREEVACLLEMAQGFCPRYSPLFLCAVRTGMRQGEILALQWGDIDFQGRFIEVRRAFSQGNLTSPKNGKVRRVDMSQQLTQALSNLKLRREAEEALSGRSLDPETWVFTNSAASPIDPTNLVKRAFYPCLQKAGLRRIRFHDLRHTYASLLIQQGESLAYVKEQLGHHSIQVTVDVYGHLIPGANKAAVDRLDGEQPGATYTQPGTGVGLEGRAN